MILHGGTRSALFRSMSPVTHLMMGWAVANTTPLLSRRERAFVTWASVIPDVDGLGIVAEILTRNSATPITWWSDYHHVLGHNIAFALLATGVAACLARQKLKVALLVFLSFHLHLVGDLVGARGPDGDQWPIPYLLPFSDAWQWVWSGQWALNGWPNLIITAGLIVLAVLLARSRGFSPLELFSRRADAVF